MGTYIDEIYHRFSQMCDLPRIGKITGGIRALYESLYTTYKRDNGICRRQPKLSQHDKK